MGEPIIILVQHKKNSIKSKQSKQVLLSLIGLFLQVWGS